MDVLNYLFHDEHYTDVSWWHFRDEDRRYWLTSRGLFVTDDFGTMVQVNG